MKRLIYSVLLLGATTLAAINFATAQKGINPYSNLTPAKVDQAMTQVAADDAAGNMKGIHPRAIDDFSSNFRNVTNERWYKISSGFTADFFSDGVQHIIYYTPKGKWCGSLARYHEEKLPFEIRKMVKQTYYDDAIVYVQEVETVDTGSSPVYFINLEGAKTIKLIRVADGDMAVINEFERR